MMMYATAFDASTGLSNVQLLDLHTGLTTTVDDQPRAFSPFEVFTADSKYALYVADVDFSTQLGALFAADRSGSARQISEDRSVYVNFAATGSVVSFNDQPVFNSAPAGSFNFTTADLHVVDAGRPNKPARLIAKQAYVFYFPSHDRRGLVFTTDAADQPGLYLASARP
jgi:hypothetical protein